MANSRSRNVTKESTVRHFKKCPSIYEFRLFVALCDAASPQRKKVSDDKEDAASEEGNKVKTKSLAQIQRDLKRLGWNPRYETIKRCLRAMEVYWNTGKGSLFKTKPGEIVRVTDEGREARAVAMRIIDAVDQTNLIRWNRRHVVRFATHNVYELVLVPELLQKFIEESGGVENVELQTYEISDIWQGIDLLRTGTVSLVLDGVAEKPQDEFILAEDLGVAWKRIVLVPKQPSKEIREKVNALPKRRDSKWLTLEQLADLPLCFVERGDVFESELTRGAKAPRLGLGSIEAVRRLVKTRHFLGLSINWTRVLGEDCGSDFDIRFLQTNRPDLKLWLCRNVNWNDSSPAGTFYKVIKNFFDEEKIACDYSGRRRILLPPKVKDAKDEARQPRREE